MGLAILVLHFHHITSKIVPSSSDKDLFAICFLKKGLYSVQIVKEFVGKYWDILSVNSERDVASGELKLPVPKKRSPRGGSDLPPGGRSRNPQVTETSCI